MNTINTIKKNQTVNVTINGVEFNIDIDVAIKAGIAKPVRTHKIGNYYRWPATGNIYILIRHVITHYNGYYNRVSLVAVTGHAAGVAFEMIDFPNTINKLTEDEFTSVARGMELELIDNPLVK
jgi:hypothetical protein